MTALHQVEAATVTAFWHSITTTLDRADRVAGLLDRVMTGATPTKAVYPTEPPVRPIKD